MTREEYNKHKELIQAFGNGAKIQYYDEELKKWIDIENPLWSLKTKYKIKSKIDLENCHFNDEEYCVDGFGRINKIEATTFNTKDRTNFIKNKEIAEAYAVLPQLIRLMNEYNEGWRPDWKDGCIKYFLYFMRDSIKSSYSINSSYLLSFKTEEIRDKFLQDHRDLIEIAKPLL